MAGCAIGSPAGSTAVVLIAAFGHVSGGGRGGGCSWQGGCLQWRSFSDLDLELPFIVVGRPLEAMMAWLPLAGCVGGAE